MKSIRPQSAPAKFTLNLEAPISIRSANSVGKVLMITLPPNFDKNSRNKVHKTFEEIAGGEAKGDNPLFRLGFYRNKAVLQAKITSKNKMPMAEIEIPASVNKKIDRIIEGMNKTICEETNRSIVRSVIGLKIRAEASDPRDLFPQSENGYVPKFDGNGW